MPAMDAVAEQFIDIMRKEPQQRTDEDVVIASQQLSLLDACKKLNVKQVQDIAGSSTLQFLEAGETLFKQGDTSTEFYIVFLGGVDVLVSKTGNEEDAEKVVSLASGASFGELAALNGTPRNATIRANAPTTLVRVRSSTYQRVMGVVVPTALSEVAEESEESPALSSVEASMNDLSVEQQEADEAKIAEDDPATSAQAAAAAAAAEPEDMLRLALEKAPSDRTPEDLADILDEMNHLKAFSHLSTSVRKELCAVIGFEVLEKKGDVLFNQGDAGSCWYVTYRGSVDVVINGVVVVTLAAGEGFGELALINDKPRAATIVAAEDDCAFMKVEKADYNRILKDIESNTIRLEEHGKVVTVLEKKVVENNTGYVVMAATPEKLVAHLEEDHVADSTYILDFLLTFRTFMSTHELWDTFFARFKLLPQGGAAEAAEQAQSRSRRKIVSAVRLWILNHHIDFENDVKLVDRAHEFLDMLRDAGMDAEHDLIMTAMSARGMDTRGRLRLRGALADKVSVAKKTDTISSQSSVSKKRSVRRLLAKSFGRLGGRNSDKGDSTDTEVQQHITETAPSISTFVPAHPDWTRIHLADGTYRTTKVEPMTTARELIESACVRFSTQGLAENAMEPAMYKLYEVRSDGAMKAFDDDECALLSKLSLNGRLFLKRIDRDEQLERLDPAELMTKTENSGLLDMDTEEVARLLTLLDHELMCRIDPLEYIWHIYKVKGTNTTNLNNFSNRFNQLNYWVVTEVVQQKSLTKRVLLLKKFIRIATILRSLNNFNGCFAVLSGLANAAVSRLVNTWKKVPAKYMAEFEQLQALMDPSRNMKTYRNLLMNSSPPLIPFFPVVIKDLFFVHECNDSKINGLVNFDKLRLLANIIRFVDAFRFVQYEAIQQPNTINRRRSSMMDSINEGMLERAASVARITEYVSTMQVIDDMRLLSSISHNTEKNTVRVKRSSSFGKI